MTLSPPPDGGSDPDQQDAVSRFADQGLRYQFAEIGQVGSSQTRPGQGMGSPSYPVRAARVTAGRAVRVAVAVSLLVAVIVILVIFLH